MAAAETVIIPADEMLKTFHSILLREGFPAGDAMQCAQVFRDSTIDGVYTHGVNRFPRFVDYVRRGFVKPGNKPTLRNKAGNIEQWNGELGAGPLNALFATEAAMRLAKEAGIGCVALANTNHWMRGGTYGWHAAKQGFVFIGFTNTIANMPAWGGMEKVLGNNPLVLAVPHHDEAIVLDMAVSQYSIGALNQSALKNESLPVPGGFDKDGELTTNAQDILDTGRVLPIGYWKGSGLALLLDILAALLSGGLSTNEIGKLETEYSVSQVFIAIDCKKLDNFPSINNLLDNIIASYQGDDKEAFRYPGQKVLQTREKNLKNGIPVLKAIWEEILQL